MSTETKKEAKKETKPAASMGLDDESDSKLQLVSKDKKVHEVERKFANISKLVFNALENEKEAIKIDMLAVKSSILGKIVDYMNHHKGSEPPIIEKPLRSKKMADVCKDKWDATFIDKIGENRQTLYDVILAANYMDIPGLLHLGCAKVASLIKGQPLEKIKDILDPNAKKSEKKEQKEEKKEDKKAAKKEKK